MYFLHSVTVNQDIWRILLKHPKKQTIINWITHSDSCCVYPIKLTWWHHKIMSVPQMKVSNVTLQSQLSCSPTPSARECLYDKFIQHDVTMIPDIIIEVEQLLKSKLWAKKKIHKTFSHITWRDRKKLTAATANHHRNVVLCADVKTKTKSLWNADLYITALRQLLK